MKLQILWFFLLAPIAAVASELIELTPDDGVKLVECSVTSSDYQKIDILALNSGKLALRLLDRTGATQSYELPRREWKARHISIPCWNSKNSVCGDLTEQSANDWIYEISGASGISMGNCR